MKNVLILGGTRFFGKKLVSLLLEEGHHVTIATRGNVQDSFGEKVNRIIVDRTQPQSLESAAGGQSWDLVYDNICYSPEDAAEACRIFKGHVQKYILTSTLSVYEYGSAKKREEDFDPITYPLAWDQDSSISYGEGKRLAEAVFFQKADFPVSAVRFPIVLGEDDYTKRLHFHVKNILNEMAIGVPNREAVLSFIHSDEAARFLAWLGGNDLAGPVNACSNGEISLNSLFNLIEKYTGKEALIQQITKDEQMSPFGVTESWYMDNSRAAEQGFVFDDLDKWLPALVQKLVKEESLT
ncbi:nucleoside-diphosphate-sugar epimerase [Peribacillus deserti]|uniref:Nucleoside-diphosphate-sugar epimerase n=1 Tax=Peribacillus deserti TaxID=673318 RepID=A0ABS2QPQ1_9BACI|nr:NAD-dependent epimerase/dehydratase family protein [Peribacillus deserti]MBM7694709.1 nucleoside-diphosphate-sugar epimerase [Peribacillus deserti]